MTYLIIGLWLVTGFFGAVAMYHVAIDREVEDLTLSFWLKIVLVFSLGPVVIIGLAFMFVLNYLSSGELIK